MTLPLALTLGEPAGIGPDITLAAWSRRAELDLPSFYVLADPQALERRAKKLGLDVPLEIMTPATAASADDHQHGSSKSHQPIGRSSRVSRR